MGENVCKILGIPVYDSAQIINTDMSFETPYAPKATFSCHDDHFCNYMLSEVKHYH